MQGNNPDFIHHNKSSFVENIRQIVFGMQDGMVSTLGALTGIAVGSGDLFTVILAGFVIIAVESISMGIGSYTAGLSERQIGERMLFEEKIEIREFPEEEKEELFEMFLRDGWPKEMAKEMTEVAVNNKNLMLNEMAYRELNISPHTKKHPLKKGFFMFFAYIAGGLIALFPYFWLSLETGLYVSIGVTLFGLFLLGTSIAQYTRRGWVIAGSRVLLLGSVALLAGYVVGTFADSFIK